MINEWYVNGRSTSSKGCNKGVRRHVACSLKCEDHVRVAHLQNHILLILWTEELDMRWKIYNIGQNLA